MLLITLSLKLGHKRTWLEAFQDCVACKEIRKVKGYQHLIIKNIVQNYCMHANKQSCCCSKHDKIDDDDVNSNDTSEILKNSVFVSQLGPRNDVRFFCNIYRRYGLNSSGRAFFNGGDWCIKGVSFKGMYHKKNVYMLKLPNAQTCFI